jgi:hypothetical protein
MHRCITGEKRGGERERERERKKERERKRKREKEREKPLIGLERQKGQLTTYFVTVTIASRVSK